MGGVEPEARADPDAGRGRAGPAEDGRPSGMGGADEPEAGRACGVGPADDGRACGIGGAGEPEGRDGLDTSRGGAGGVRGFAGGVAAWSWSRPTAGGVSGKRADAWGGGGVWEPEVPVLARGVSPLPPGAGRVDAGSAGAPVPVRGAVPALPVGGVRVPNASKGSALRQGDHTPVGPNAAASAGERPPDLSDTGREPSPPDTALPFLPPPGDASGPAPPVAAAVSLCASEPSVPTVGGRDGRGGKEACRGSVVMHPPFPRAPGRLHVREPWSLRSFTRRRFRRGRSVPITHTRTSGPASRCSVCGTRPSAVRARHSTA